MPARWSVCWNERVMIGLVRRWYCHGGAAIGGLSVMTPSRHFAKAQAVIDFTAPDATIGFAELAAHRAVHVIGTTGGRTVILQSWTAAARHA
jgi:4-hydroxy-tetrahydrodipicolinate reductase